MTKSATCTLRNRNIQLHVQLNTNMSEICAIGNTLNHITISTLYFSINITLSHDAKFNTIFKMSKIYLQMSNF